MLGDYAANFYKEIDTKNQLIDLKNNLVFSAQFFDAYYIIMGSSAYYLYDYMGSAKVLSDNTYNKAENEYSNKYVMQQQNDFYFGDNTDLFEFITKIKTFYSEFKNIIDKANLEIMQTEHDASFAWYYTINSIIKLLFIVQPEDNKNIEIDNDFTLIYADELSYL